MKRDFTTDTKNQLLQLIRETQDPEWFSSGSTDWAEDLITSDVREKWKALEQAYAKTIEKNNVVENDIENMWNTVLQLDVAHAQRLWNLNELAQAYLDKLKLITEKIRPGEIENTMKGDPAALKEGFLALDTVIYSKKVEVLLTEEQIKNMRRDLGYTDLEILTLWENAKTDNDKEFLKYLMTGTEESYEKLFLMNPGDISDEMMLGMTEYAFRLFDYDATGRFQTFNNALLAETTGFYDPESMTVIMNRDVYLDRLYAYTSESTKCLAAQMAAMDPGAEGYGEMYSEYQKRFALTGLWVSEILIKEDVDRLEGKAVPLEVMFGENSVGELTFTVQFKSVYDSDGLATKKITTRSLASNEVESQWWLEGIAELEERKENILRETAASIVKDGVSAVALAVLGPWGAFAVSGVFTVDDLASSGKASSISVPDMGKGGSFVQDSAVTIMNGLQDWSGAYNELERENWERKMSWFGLGSGMNNPYGEDTGLYNAFGEAGKTEVLFADIYNPDMIRGIECWQKEGIAGWMGLEEEVVNSMKDYLDSSCYEDENITEQQKQTCIALLEGGYDIYGITDMTSFEDATIELGAAYKHAIKEVEGRDLENFNIKAAWGDYINNSNN